MKNFEGIQRGDILQHKTTGNSFVIVTNLDEGRLIGVRTIIITNPSEWKKFCRTCKRVEEE